MRVQYPTATFPMRFPDTKNANKSTKHLAALQERHSTHPQTTRRLGASWRALHTKHPEARTTPSFCTRCTGAFCTHCHTTLRTLGGGSLRHLSLHLATNLIDLILEHLDLIRHLGRSPATVPLWQRRVSRATTRGCGAVTRRDAQNRQICQKRGCGKPGRRDSARRQQAAGQSN